MKNNSFIPAFIHVFVYVFVFIHVFVQGQTITNMLDWLLLQSGNTTQIFKLMFVLFPTCPYDDLFLMWLVMLFIRIVWIRR